MALAVGRAGRWCCCCWWWCCCWWGGRRGGWRGALAAALAGLGAAGALVGCGAHEELLSRALALWVAAPVEASPGPPEPSVSPSSWFALEPAVPAGCGAGAGAGEAPLLLALVASAAGHWRARAAVRGSWGSGGAVRPLFVVGEAEGLQAALEGEARRHGDLLQGRFADTYGNLTRKTLCLLRWAALRCPAARFVLKADDDVFVNVPALARHLAALDAARPLYLGRVHWRARPDRRPASRHHVPAALLAAAAYPPYCSGTAYVLSAPAVAALLRAAPRLPPVPVEDAFVGLLARRAGLAPRHLPRMAGAARLLPPDPCCYRHVLFSVHGLDPRAMQRAWQQSPRDGPAACSPLQRALGLLRCRFLAWRTSSPSPAPP
ncbi:beta-1,3-galactosyltransferase 4 [Heteronotia binoei]|uniref:beta-1,3-galactosyltransferase 4 n=1 Tax=Heteronotia binoei TaxID=13085 RepID=UPI00292E4936|nr:beta-1,3-galactosyltransferase 4 [Heteronotia binoei]